MSIIERKIERLLELRERGLVTEAEVQNDTLLILAGIDDLQHLTELCESLPDQLQATIRSRLNELQQTGFQWRPFFIGEGLNEAELERLRERLRFIHGTLFDTE